VSAGPVSLSA